MAALTSNEPSIAPSSNRTPPRRAPWRTRTKPIAAHTPISRLMVNEISMPGGSGCPRSSGQASTTATTIVAGMVTARNSSSNWITRALRRSTSSTSGARPSQFQNAFAMPPCSIPVQ
ncbi:hypothetical protein NB706_003384 [Xanthomonas sacchari]|nr:hypothetical protein [Xanthomonas sacchari]